MTSTKEPRAAHRVAVLLDFDNAQLAAENLRLDHCRASRLWVGPLLAEVERSIGGAVEVRWCYGDAMLAARHAARTLYKGAELKDCIRLDEAVQQDLVDNGFRMIHTPTVRSGLKNKADIVMCLDAVELAQTAPHIDTFAILSHDTDFSPLVLRLRALGRKVALITVGTPKSSGFRSLRALANWHVIFDQVVINRAGYDALGEVVADLKADPKALLASGVPLPSLLARVRAKYPGFAHEALGFDRASDFVDACLDEPLIRRGSKVVDPSATNHRHENTRETGTRSPLSASTPARAKAPGQTKRTREQEISTALKRRGIRPEPELRPKVGRWLRDELFDGSNPKDPALTYGALMEAAKGHFGPLGHSNRAIADAVKTYSIAGVLDVAGEGSLNDRVVAAFLPLDSSRPEIAALAIDILLDEGFELDDDAEHLARVIFGDASKAFLDVIDAGWVLVDEEEQEEGDATDDEPDLLRQSGSFSRW